MGGYERLFPCVKLRGLPFDVTEDDIRMFLVGFMHYGVADTPYGTHDHETHHGATSSNQGTDTIDVVIAKRNGRPNGEAFVVLSAPQLMHMALQRDKTYLGRRYVEVFRCRKHDYYRAVSNVVAENPEGHPGSAPPGGPPAHASGAYNNYAAQYAGPQAQSRPSEAPAVPDAILKLRGLPFSATAHDIVQFFADPQLTLSQPVTMEQYGTRVRVYE